MLEAAVANRCGFKTVPVFGPYGVPIGCSHVARDFGPAMLLGLGILLLSLREVEGHRALPRQAPNGRKRSPPRDQVTPMLFHLTHPHLGQKITPTSDNARDEAMVGQVLDTNVGRVEIGGVD